MSAKAYADWTASFLRPVLGDFRANAIELVQLLTSTASQEHKNTADIQLTVDALEMVFSPVRPDIVVIVGGDRDYVPLVQKLKRYGVFVMGIGVEAGVSRVLIEACDSFIYYDDIVPPAPEEIAEPVSLPDPADAYSLMRRAVEALHREGRGATGASVHAMMKQLAPAFDLTRYKTTLKVLTEDAQKAGYVIVTEHPGSDFTVAVVASSAAVLPAPEAAKREYDFSTLVTMTASYRTILQERRIPLLPWLIREKFMSLIWAEMDNRGDTGMSIEAMRGVLLDYVEQNNLPVSEQMIRKLLYTLNIARCFNYRKGAPAGWIISIPTELYSPLYPVVSVEEAVHKLHERYLEILSEQAAILHPAAVYDLLYGDEVIDGQEIEERRTVLAEMCERAKPLNQMGQALLDASSRANFAAASKD